MLLKFRKRSWFWPGLVLAMALSVSANAMPSPIVRVGTASKTILQKTADGTKAVARAPVRVAKDAAIGAKDVTVSVVNHVRSI